MFESSCEVALEIFYHQIRFITQKIIIFVRLQN